jgi:hypothetical protein
MKKAFDPNCITFSQMHMIFNSRLFRRYQAVWTRVYITSRYEGIGTAEEAFGRLYLENADFADQLQIMFGHTHVNNYAQLLNEFSIGIREMITTQLRGDTEAMQMAVNRLYRNTEERAAFLASIIPYIDEKEMQSMFAEYLRLTIEEANSFASHNYSRDIELYDKIILLKDRIGYVFAKALYDYITSGGECIKDLNPGECLTYEQMNAIFYIRMLFFEVVTWVRYHMLSVVEDIGNEEEVHARLRLVAKAYGDAMRMIFGEEAGIVSEQDINLFIDLLDGLLVAQMEDNIDQINENSRLLYQVAHDHAQHLASINPAWKESRWDAILFDMIRSMVSMSTTLLAGEYALHMDIFATLLANAEAASEYFSEGIYQFMTSNGGLGI